MKDTLKEIPAKLKGFFTRLDKKLKLLLVVCAIVAAVVIVAVVVINASRPYSVLFTGLSSDDASAIVAYLEESGVTDYKVQGSDTILVPRTQESQLKARLLMQGYPSSGFAYSTYKENVGTLSTESDRQTAFLFELQDRMGAVIRCLDGVKDAWVNIAPGEDNRYVLDSGNIVDASAAVVVQMSGTQQLSAQQAEAIRNLVSHSVSGLDIGNVSISDSLGNTYNAGESSASSDSSQLKLRLEEQVNNTVRTNVMQVLIPFFGEDNVRVSVNSTVDISRTVGTSTTYTEPEWASDGSTDGEGIIGSKIYDNVVTRETADNVGGVAGTETNSDINTYVEDELEPDGTETVISSSGQIDYNVDTDVRQTERTAGIVTDLMVSVSIDSDAVNVISDTSLLSHVARAAGISDELKTEKISMLARPFYREQSAATLPSGLEIPTWAIYAAIGGAALFVIIIIIILILARKRKKKRAGSTAVYFARSQQEPVLAGANIMDIQPEKSMELRRDIRDFADKNPEIAAQMIRGWLKGGGEDG